MKTLSPLSVINAPPGQFSQAGQGTINPKAEVSGLTQFTQGQLLRAVVLSAGPNNQFTLDAGGDRILVQTKAPLTTGQTLDLQVVSSGAKPELQIVQNPEAQYFGRSLASSAGRLDFTSFFNLLNQTGQQQLANLSETGLKNLQQFSQLQGQVVSTANPQNQAVNHQDFGQKLLSEVFSRLAEQFGNTPATNTPQSSLSAFKSALQDIAFLFQNTTQVSAATQTQINNLAPARQQLVDILSVLQLSSKTGPPSDELVNTLFQNLQLQTGSYANTSNLINSFNSLQSGLTDLIFLLKGPDAILQFFSEQGFSSGLLTKSQVEAILSSATNPVASQNNAGEQLQKLIQSLGLSFEGKLAAGNVDGAINTVKSSIMELLQNLMGSTKLSESGTQTLKTIEFYQLMQLQMERQDTLILPLPLPFLDQGYLAIEDYKKQLAGEDGKGEALTHFSLYLKLAPLGNLKIDFLYSGEGVYLRFNSDSKQISEFLTEHKKELSQSVTSTVIQSVSFSENSEDPLAAILQKSGSKTSIFDTKA